MNLLSFFRNQEMAKDLLAYSIILAVCGILLFFFCGLPACLFGCAGIIFCAILHFHSEQKLYRNLRKMSEEIEQILQGEHIELLKDCEEGELFILATQLNKMVRSLKEQSEKAEQGKVFLADSLADISHQLKTPLTSMNLVISFLGEQQLSDAKRYELARELKKLTGKIEWLIYALLRISKLDAGTVLFAKTSVSVAELLKKVRETMELSLELREISWEESLQPDVFIFCDASWMQEAIQNIVKNCMEHTPAGGTLRVSAADNAIYTEILIQDTGTGIAKEDLPHIFERFYRGKDADQSSAGIGLALARKIILAQHGTITAANRKHGKGAEFVIRIYKTTV